MRNEHVSAHRGKGNRTAYVEKEDASVDCRGHGLLYAAGTVCILIFRLEFCFSIH